ncbi:MAG TPA: DUF1648 domain-containing protein [Chryseosolibacter sp.]|nr:DUF1648 domain-containing protein [Chryseosolibacter sp.]
MKNYLRRDGLILMFLLMPFIIIFLKWNDFPDSIPIHFDVSGKPDKYSDKAFGLFLLPLMNIGLYLLLLAIPAIDPKKYNFEKFKDKYLIIRIGMHVFITFVFALIAAHSLGYQFDFSMLLLYGVLMLLVLLGNYLRTVRPNFFIGIRTPWTLANEYVWTRTHRFTATLWVITTLVMMICLHLLYT